MVCFAPFILKAAYVLFINKIKWFRGDFYLEMAINGCVDAIPVNKYFVCDIQLYAYVTDGL